MSRQVNLWLTALVILSLMLAGCTAIQPTTGVPAAQEGGRQLEIYHWWTAPGEREAADAMFAALKEAYPDITVMENPSPGGGGVNQRVVLQSRIAAGDYPDTFQTLGGAELKNYVDSGVLEPLDELWAELEYANVIPGPLAKAVTVDGHPYVVPLNMHIQNILYYNLPLFEELGIEPPKNFAELLAAAEAIQQAKPEMTPLALGSKEKWGDAFIFDSILLEEGGAEYYVQLHMEFPDPIRQELQRYVSENPGMLILDQHGSILPATAQPIYWDILSAFLAQPDVDSTIEAVAEMMETYSRSLYPYADPLPSGHVLYRHRDNLVVAL
jgi:ABC-type glycerol-3-phosphate transport system substrate-binding protein